MRKLILAFLFMALLAVPLSCSSSDSGRADRARFVVTSERISLTGVFGQVRFYCDIETNREYVLYHGYNRGSFVPTGEWCGKESQ